MSDAGLSDVTSLKLRLLEAADDITKLSDVLGYDPQNVSREENLDEHLKLKLQHLAAWIGDVSTIEYLGSVGDAIATTEGGFTPLHLAASRGHSLVLRLLLQWPNANAETPSSEGFTALHLAAHGGHFECVEALLRCCPTKAHVNARDKVMGRTALHWAAAHASSRRVFDLLSEAKHAGMILVNVCSKDKAGFTPMHFAMMNVMETELRDDKISILLEEIRNPRVLNETSIEWITRVRNETSEEWMKEIFQDETKRSQLEQMYGLPAESVRTREQMVHRMLEGVPQQMVKTLIEGDPLLVNDTVGDVDRFLSMPDVRDFGSVSWRKLSGITSVHPAKRDLQRFMSGYTALHFAATQNNAGLVTHLLSFPETKANDREMIHGATPLHCSLLNGSMKAFARLMSSERVDVNAPLDQGRKGEHPVWLPTGIELQEFGGSVSSDNFITFGSLDTPVHIGIRFCPPEDFLPMMIQFCNHSKFNPAICNREGVLPLQLAWQRSRFTVRYPDSCTSSPEPAAASTRWTTERQEKAFKELQCALDIFEGHPGNSVIMTHHVTNPEHRYQNLANAALVSATVVAGLAFSGALQQPTFKSTKSSGAFWFSISFSFFGALRTVVICLFTFTTRFSQKKHHRFTKLHRNSVDRLPTILIWLLLSLVFGAIAFTATAFDSFFVHTDFAGKVMGCIISALLYILAFSPYDPFAWGLLGLGFGFGDFPRERKAPIGANI